LGPRAPPGVASRWGHAIRAPRGLAGAAGAPRRGERSRSGGPGRAGARCAAPPPPCRAPEPPRPVRRAANAPRAAPGREPQCAASLPRGRPSQAKTAKPRGGATPAGVPPPPPPAAAPGGAPHADGPLPAPPAPRRTLSDAELAELVEENRQLRALLETYVDRLAADQVRTLRGRGWVWGGGSQGDQSWRLSCRGAGQGPPAVEAPSLR
jgi:hypothetical protein